MPFADMTRIAPPRLRYRPRTGEWFRCYRLAPPYPRGGEVDRWLVGPYPSPCAAATSHREPISVRT